MFAALASIRIWLYAAGIGVLAGGFLYYRHTLILDGEQKVEAAVKKSTDKLTAQNAAALAKQAKADADFIAQIESNYETTLHQSDVDTAALNSRLRAYTLARSGEAAVPGNPPAAGKPDDSAGKPGSVEQAVEGVAAAAAHDAGKLTALQDYVSKVCH